MIGIYSNPEVELSHGLQFIKDGLDKNESAILITDVLPREKMRYTMSNRWDTKDIEKLEQTGDLTIASSHEWYLSDQGTSGINIRKIINSWNRFSYEAIRRGKRGIRAFGDTNKFFSLGLVDCLVEYEGRVGREPAFPITAICAYLKSDLTCLTHTALRRLQDCHKHVFFFP